MEIQDGTRGSCEHKYRVLTPAQRKTYSETIHCSKSKIPRTSYATLYVNNNPSETNGLKVKLCNLIVEKEEIQSQTKIFKAESR